MTYLLASNLNTTILNRSKLLNRSYEEVRWTNIYFFIHFMNVKQSQMIMEMIKVISSFFLSFF